VTTDSGSRPSPEIATKCISTSPSDRQSPTTKGAEVNSWPLSCIPGAHRVTTVSLALRTIKQWSGRICALGRQIWHRPLDPTVHFPAGSSWVRSGVPGCTMRSASAGGAALSRSVAGETVSLLVG
jgi:hypothetical protein